MQNSTSSFPVFDVLGMNTMQYWLQLSSVYYATRALFIGNMVDNAGLGYDFATTITGQFSFLEIVPNNNFGPAILVWGDVLKGIEEMSKNVTAALLTLQLGNISSTCFYDQQTLIYRYDSFALWIPYGVESLLFTLML